MALFGSAKDCMDVFNKVDRFIITTHEKPDGDAIGSCLALYNYTKTKGKDSKIINISQTPDNLKFLPNSSEIIEYKKEQHEKEFLNADAIFILDINDISRLGEVGEAIKKSNAIVVVIDHHVSPENDHDYCFMDTTASSAGELIYKFLQEDEGLRLDTSISDPLYVAILMDTGSFRFDRTDAEVHRIVAELIETGSIPGELYDRVYNTRTLNGFKLKSLVEGTIELYYNNRFSAMIARREYFIETGASRYDTEGFVEEQMSIKGVEACVLLTQTPDNDEIRLSFRSKSIPVRDIAVSFGGGGHQHASGGKIHGVTIDKAKEIVVDKVGELF